MGYTLTSRTPPVDHVMRASIPSKASESKAGIRSEGGQVPWHCMDMQALIKRLDVNPEVGLSEAKAKNLQQIFGRNVLKAKMPKSPVLVFLEQFRNPLLYILLIAGAVKAVMQSWIEAGVISGVAVLNALIAFTQESKAESAIQALASSVTTESTVLRDGKTIKLPSSDLVPGDIVLLASGDKVPADIRLFRSRKLQANESGLTGESVAVEKHANSAPLISNLPLGERVNMAYAGSFITFGQGEGIVVETGQNTETGAFPPLWRKATLCRHP